MAKETYSVAKETYYIHKRDLLCGKRDLLCGKRDLLCGKRDLLILVPRLDRARELAGAVQSLVSVFVFPYFLCFPFFRCKKNREKSVPRLDRARACARAEDVQSLVSVFVVPCFLFFSFFLLPRKKSVPRLDRARDWPELFNLYMPLGIGTHSQKSLYALYVATTVYTKYIPMNTQ